MNLLCQTFKTKFKPSCKTLQNIWNDKLNTHTLVFVMRKFVWKELVDLEHRFDHSSALSEHPHDELKDRTEGRGTSTT